MVKILFLTTFVAFCVLLEINAQSVTMTDALRQLVLDAHNTLRSTVALGKAANKNGTTLPKAADMYKLTYSKLVESYARNNANTCSYTHDRVNGTSNNLYIWGRSGSYMPAGEFFDLIGWILGLKSINLKDLN
jgi:hypothetical protein